MVRTAWNANRHRATATFFAFTVLLVLGTFLGRRSEFGGIRSQRSAGSGSVCFSRVAAWLQKRMLPWARNEQTQVAVDFATASGGEAFGGALGGVIGGVAGGIIGNGPGDVRLATSAQQPAEQLEDTERMVVRTGKLEIIAVDPAQTAEQLRDLAMRLSGFVVSSTVSGSERQTRWSQVTLRIPAQYFDRARTQVRALAKTVEQDTVEAHDVTRDYVDQQARLQNARSEEAQYLAILKRATLVTDVMQVSSRLAEVRGRIDQSQADVRLLRHQVEMSLLTTNIHAGPQPQGFGIHWRPFYQAKRALHDALAGLADYADSMVALLLNLPVLVIWVFTIVALLKLGWMALRRIVLAFFPGLTPRLRRSQTSQPS